MNWWQWVLVAVGLALIHLAGYWGGFRHGRKVGRLEVALMVEKAAEEARELELNLGAGERHFYLLGLSNIVGAFQAQLYKFGVVEERRGGTR